VRSYEDEKSMSQEQIVQTDSSETDRPRYRIHILRGPKLIALPNSYQTVEDAKQAFEAIIGIAGWCLVAVDGPGSRKDHLFGRNAPAFVVLGRVKDEAVTWKLLGGSEGSGRPPS